jgi:predicted O-methyltransferase YrrM
VVFGWTKPAGLFILETIKNSHFPQQNLLWQSGIQQEVPNMQKVDPLVVGAMEIAQLPVSIDDLKSFLPADHVFLQLWPEISELAILHPLQALNVVERLDQALKLPGDVVECGIFQGVTSVLMARLMDIRQSDKKLFLFDSFEGLPEPDRRVDASQRFQKGGWSAGRAEVEALLARHNVLQRCVIHEGWFADTLPKLDAGQRFCFAYIDADLYASTVDCLKHLWQRLGPQSVAVFDDYHHPSGGVRKAVDDWLVDTGEILHVGPASQSFVIRGMDPDRDNVECFHLQTASGKEILISFAFLRQNKLFCSMINGRLQHLRAYEAQLSSFAGLVIGAPAGS